MNTKQEEALAIFSDILSSFAIPNPDLKTIFRKALFACQLLGWQQQYTWFYKELYGYASGDPLPSYRKIRGHLTWVIDSDGWNKIHDESERMVYGKSKIETEAQPEEIFLDVTANIEWILSACNSGYHERTDTVKVGTIGSGRKVPHRRMRQFPQYSFLASIREIQRISYDFVTRSYIQLKYGNTIQGLWEQYRSAVETKLTSLGFSNHLREIEEGIMSGNPESWRSTLYECRSLLADVAEYLWHDPRPTYEHLPGRGPGNKLEVTNENFANRLSAYLHQKGLTGSSGKFIRDEVERLATSIRSLIGYQSTAHAPVQKQDALTVALATYFILGELVLKTDMNPIEQYVPPASF